MDYKSEDQKENEIVNLETVMKKSVALTSWNFSQKEMQAALQKAFNFSDS